MLAIVADPYGGRTPQFDRRVYQAWHPVVWYVKGQYLGRHIRDARSSQRPRATANSGPLGSSKLNTIVNRRLTIEQLTMTPMSVRRSTRGFAVSFEIDMIC